jgi:hypothetical protein
MYQATNDTGNAQTATRVNIADRLCKDDLIVLPCLSLKDWTEAAHNISVGVYAVTGPTV